jgi:hypothetical protein
MSTWLEKLTGARSFSAMTMAGSHEEPSSIMMIASGSHKEPSSIMKSGARQSTLEASQDRARAAFRDLTTVVREIQSRVQALEAQSKQRLLATQRGTLYQLVQTWGQAQATRKPDGRSGESIRACWRQFNQRFGISTYTDLPAARYDEAIQFIKQQYHALTGADIDALEQSGMELE